MHHIFTCICTATKHWQDQDNYPTSREYIELKERESLEELYLSCARFKAYHEEGIPSQYGEYTTVSFGPIREITVHRMFDLEEECLTSTDPWKKHQQKLDAAAEKKRQQEQDNVTRKEAQERAQLKALQAKYGEKA